ncbi:hypothetical protein [Actinoplanes missouriensis]|uniref:hypothetical protein n=1 Tax=Actinoplanes missouriensis TaxID=1866 RepID=UPI0002FC75D3|nr:hypothetical protein [Actinoplanes missouriensis]
MTVLQAFGVDGPARPLAGGQGTSWVAGELVFKPDDGVLATTNERVRSPGEGAGLRDEARRYELAAAAIGL